MLVVKGKTTSGISWRHNTVRQGRWPEEPPSPQ